MLRAAEEELPAATAETLPAAPPASAVSAPGGPLPSEGESRLFNQGSIGWAVFMLIWGFGVSSVDNVIKPWLISHGSATPFIFIFFGVLGGALGFGVIGVFLGPTLLALVYRLSRSGPRHAQAARPGRRPPARRRTAARRSWPDNRLQP